MSPFQTSFFVPSFCPLPLSVSLGRLAGSAVWHVVTQSEPTSFMQPIWPCRRVDKASAVSQSEPALLVYKHARTEGPHHPNCMTNVYKCEMESKRKAISPCVSLKVKSAKFTSPKIPSSPSEFFSPNSDFSSTGNMSLKSLNESGMDSGEVFIVSYTVDNRNGEKFRGALDRPTAKTLWEKGLNLPGSLISGIALNQSTDRSFMIDYDLSEALPWDDCPLRYEVTLDGAKYDGVKYVPKPKPPELGEEILIRIKKTRFKIRPHQAAEWIKHFGIITKTAEYENAADLPSVTCDDIVLKARLRKHIPGILPAFGRKMIVMYPGQPILCGKCFQLGHVRSKCERAENVKWIVLVKLFADEAFVTKEMLGDWADLLEKTEDEDL